jgi:hypothetical protein
VIGVFAPDGPTQCSGLPVRRQSVDELINAFGDITPIAARHELHHTPDGAVQSFTWLAARLH